MKALAFSLLLAAPSTLLAASPQKTACAQTVSHAEERACWERLSRSTTSDLRQAEQNFLRKLAASDREAEYKSRTERLFKSASKSFLAYRNAQCEVWASLANGGNGAGDMHLACLVQLNRIQTQDVRSLEEAAR